MNKKVFVTCVILLFCAFCSTAKIFELGVSAGIQTGTVKEYVFNDNGTKISELDWDVNISPTITLSGKLDILNIILEASVLSAIPVEAGEIDDYDWVTGSSNYVYDYKVCHSNHDMKLNKHYDLEVRLGYDFHDSKISVLPQIGFLYRNQKFEANSGWGQYSSDGSAISSSTAVKYFSGTILTYEQEYFLPFVSVISSYKIRNDLEASFFGRIYPYLIVNSLDNHYTTSTSYYDEERGGFGFSLGTEIQYKGFAFSVNYEYLKKLGGNTKTRTIGVGDYSWVASDGEPGVSSSVWSFVLSYKI